MTDSSRQADEAAQRAETRERGAAVVFEVFLRDMKRIFTNPIALIVFAGILVLPSLYAWYNIAACWDPYAHTSGVKVAVVNNDEAYESELAGTLNIGQTLQTKLESNTSIGWSFVDEDTAMDGVNSGDYYAAIIIPADFSKSFAEMLAAQDGQERQAPQLDYYVNEKINNVAVKATDTAASTIESQINTTFSSAVSKVVSEIVLSFSQGIEESADEANASLVQKLGNLKTGLGSLRETLGLANDSLALNQEALRNTKTMLVSLGATLDDVNATLEQTEASIAVVQANVDGLYELYRESGMTLLLEILKNLSNDLSTMSGLLDRTSDTVAGISPLISSTQSLLDSLYGSLGQLSASNTSTDESLARIQENLDGIAERLTELSASADSGLLGALLGLDPSSIAEFLKNPITLNTEKIYPVENYGSGVAPFYTNLALWVGAFILAALMRVEVSRTGLKRKRLTQTRAYLGRGLLFFTAAIAQGFICCMGDLALGVQCTSPVAFVLTGMFLSLVYANIVYMLAATFKHVGKALAMVLIILQIPGSSGMYPIEMMPHAIQAIHPFLPFTFGIDAMRETMAGFYGLNILGDIAALLVIMAGALALGLLLRPRMANLVLLFDRTLRKTDFMVCEEEGHFENEEHSFKESVRTLLHSEAYREEALLQIGEFEAAYEKRRKRGLIAMALGPVAILAAVSVVGCFVEIDINLKLVLMFLWVVVLGVCALNLVRLEYTRQRFEAEKRGLEAGDGDGGADDGSGDGDGAPGGASGGGGRHAASGAMPGMPVRLTPSAEGGDA